MYMWSLSASVRATAARNTYAAAAEAAEEEEEDHDDKGMGCDSKGEKWR